MNADAFRHLYEYHFGMSRHVWDSYVVPLSQEDFIRDAAYSHGSVRNQIIHMIDTDTGWFVPLRGVEFPGDLDPARFDDRNKIRARWDDVERDIRAYLDTLRDDMLLTRPLSEGADKNLYLWQMLIHVVNHGTDHRAQLLRLLNDLGVETIAQDYIYYADQRPFAPTEG
jgi:uncharacterized damage-inducible protein DinB